MVSALWLIVTGPPAAGKTTLARRIAHDLEMPLFEKDVFKDILNQAIGYGDKDWSRKVGGGAIESLFLIADQMLRSGASLITECNFYRHLSSQQAGEIAKNANARVVQVHCSAPAELLLSRNVARLVPPDLRPGHHVMPSEELVHGINEGLWDPLDIPSQIIRVDTSDSFDYVDAIGAIRQTKVTL